jgi:hypothetical protein
MSDYAPPSAERKWARKLRDSFRRKSVHASVHGVEYAPSEAPSDISSVATLDLVSMEKKKKSLRKRLSGSFKVHVPQLRAHVGA